MQTFQHTVTITNFFITDSFCQSLSNIVQSRSSVWPIFGKYKPNVIRDASQLR